MFAIVNRFRIFDKIFGCKYNNKTSLFDLTSYSVFKKNLPSQEQPSNNLTYRQKVKLSYDWTWHVGSRAIPEFVLYCLPVVQQLYLGQGRPHSRAQTPHQSPHGTDAAQYSQSPLWRLVPGRL